MPFPSRHSGWSDKAREAAAKSRKSKFHAIDGSTHKNIEDAASRNRALRSLGAAENDYYIKPGTGGAKYKKGSIL